MTDFSPGLSFLICEMGAVKNRLSLPIVGWHGDTHRASPPYTPGLELRADNRLLLNPPARGGHCYCALVTDEETEAQSGFSHQGPESKLLVVSYSCPQQ